MANDSSTLSGAEALALASLITPTEKGIASRVLAKTGGGNVTIFAFDAGQGLSEHTAPFDALVLILEGSMKLTIGGKPVVANAGDIVRMPAHVSHALDAEAPAKMLLVMLREPKA
ncbi:MAG: cupin domain-containing protein [Deltaproteobacteria bacterium]|nr:cupin domain-containing protein [Deltaproteobacteria bacterium]